MGKKPLAHSDAPPRGPRGPDCRTTKPGRFCDSLPRPYVTQAPIAGRPGRGKARVHEQLGRAVIEDVGRQPLQPADFIDDLSVVRQHFAERQAALADALELALAAHQRFVPLEERKTLAFEQALGRRLAVQLAELGLVVEQFKLARRTGHEQVDDVLHLARKMAGARERAGWPDRT